MTDKEIEQYLIDYQEAMYDGSAFMDLIFKMMEDNDE